MRQRQLIFLMLLLPLSSFSIAEEWQPITDKTALQQLFSDVELKGELKEGVIATATYRRDGTGDLRAWGGVFQRSWKIEDDGRICIVISGRKECSLIDRSTVGERYRERNLTTGEVVIFTVTDSGIVTGKVGSTNQGGVTQPSANEVARELANPNTPLASMKLKTQYRTFDGDLPGADDQDSTTLLFQPSMPFPLDNGDSLLFRPAIPVLIEQPYFDPEKDDFDTSNGLGDISFDLAYARTTDTGWLLAAGIVATLPTATEDELGKDLWAIGPELLVGKITESYVLGAFPNHQRDFAGDGDGEINVTSSQLFAIYLPGDGWNVGSVPIVTYDWEVEEWTVPVNFTFGRTIIFAGRPWKFGVEINYYVEQPDAFGPEWMIGLDITPVVENKLASWFD